MREHQSVMLNEVLDAVGGETNVRTVVDATLGLAGHSIEILKRHPEAFLYGFDQDAEAREIAAEAEENHIALEEKPVSLALDLFATGAERLSDFDCSMTERK